MEKQANANDLSAVHNQLNDNDDLSIFENIEYTAPTISTMRLCNFGSVKEAEISFDMMNYLVGPNDSGKTTIARALLIALGIGDDAVSYFDIFRSADEIFDPNKKAIIDILIRPPFPSDQTELTNDIGFSIFWNRDFSKQSFTLGLPINNETLYNDDEESGFIKVQFIGIRVVISLNQIQNTLEVERRFLNDWGTSTDTAIVGESVPPSLDFSKYFKVFYLNDRRDISTILQNQSSYFSRLTGLKGLTLEQSKNITTILSNANREAVGQIPSFYQASVQLTNMAQAVGFYEGQAEISLISKSLLQAIENINIDFKNSDDAAFFPVARHGSGTRSLLEYQIATIIANNLIKLLGDKEDPVVILIFEEPELHAHPQIEQQLSDQLYKFAGQKLITTHSPYVINSSKLNLHDLIRVSQKNGCTEIHPFDSNYRLSQFDLERIMRDVIMHHADILFTQRAVVLCEGITEYQALPIFFKAWFKQNPSAFGIQFLSVGGQNYVPFLQLIDTLGLNWFIFSDGEKDTINTIGNMILEVFDADYTDFSNIIIIDNGRDWEWHLIDNGYSPQISNALGRYHNNPSYLPEYINNLIKDDQSYARKHNCEPKYSGQDGFNKAVYSCCTKRRAKASYAPYVAYEILTLPEPQCFPPKVRELFEQIENIVS